MPETSDDYVFDWVFLDPSRAQVLALDEVDRTAFGHLVDFLRRDPWEDGRLKTRLELDDGTQVTLYDDGHWQVIYLIVEPRIVEIWALSKDWWGAE